MRPLSRFLSVFLALILMGLSVLVASADDPDATTGNPDNNKGGDYVLMNVDLVSEEGSSADNPAYVNDKLEFLVTIYRLDGGHIVIASTGTEGLNGPFNDEVVAANDDDATIALLDDQNSYREATVHYTIQASDLGNADSRMVSFEWTYTFTAGTGPGGATGQHMKQSVKASADVYIGSRPGADEGVSEVMLDFADPAVPEMEKGNEINFTLVVSTGKYGLIENKSFTIMRQYKDADGDNDGAVLPVLGMTIDALGSNATGKTIKTSPEAYKLQARDLEVLDEGGSIEFSYSIPINEADIGEDLNKDGNYGTDTKNVAVLIATVNDAADAAARTTAYQTITTHDVVETRENIILTLPVPAPEPEATPSPYLFESEAAKVMVTGAGSAIEIHRLDIETTPITLLLGSRRASGTLLPQASGYIRDASRGQTYAVVRRADGEVRRAWISSTNEWVSHVPWNDVIAFYNVPAAVLNVVPLDGSMPEAEQLVDVAGTWYVYRAGAWRHIPNLSTFRAEGFYWCDLTTANADFFDREGAPVGTPLAARVGPPDEGYPECRGM